MEPGSTVSTDELMSYGLLRGDGYQHGIVKHGAKEFAYYDYRHGATHTRTRGRLLEAIQGVGALDYIHISSKHMQRYLDESTFRSNHREMVKRCSTS